MKNNLTQTPSDNLIRKIVFRLILISLIILVKASTGMSQLVDKSIRESNREFFFFDPMVFYSSEQHKPRLDAYIEIPLENLQFKKNSSTKMYDASINYSVKITNIAKEVVVNESITDYVSTDKSSQKNLDESAKFIVKEYFLNPGRYNVEITLSDINTKKEKTLIKQIEVTDFSKKDISFSDIMLVSNLKQENGKKVITPLVDKNIENLKDMYLFFEIYNSKDINETVDFTYRITDKNNNIIEKGDLSYSILPGINKFFEKIKTANLVFGDYKLEINGKSSGQIFAEKNFSNRISGIPVNTKELDIMIDQLIYIATSDEINKIKNGSTGEMKEKYFIEFWKSKDPSPNTAKNELMNEYYKRINTANDRYSHYIDGWKTDMGMVYIIYGEPSNIERHPFSDNAKPYEIWDFYSVNKQFIFVDESGFGDYKLATPIWDEERTKIRN